MKIRQMLCRHVCRVDSFVNNGDSSSDARISAPCVKCGKVLKAHCGLALKCRLDFSYNPKEKA